MAHFAYPENANMYVDKLVLIIEQEEMTEAIANTIKKSELPSDLPISTLGSATLPVPNAVTESSIHNWNVTSGITEEGGDILSNLSGAANVAKKYINRAGIHLNPFYLQTYEGTAPRAFDCEWTFVPQNSGEATTISSMIKEFKAWASPEPKGGSMLVQQPAFWTLIFEDKLQDMVRFKRMVCTNITVNYAPGGYSDFFKDGFPKQINLSMSFAEREIMYRKDWK